jgi:ABC-type transporter Mla subunit MlaD
MTEAKVPDVAIELAGLRREIGALTAGLTAVVATQETQTALLQLLLEAATGSDDGEGSLADALGEIARVLSEQSGLLEGIRSDLVALPASFATAASKR